MTRSSIQSVSSNWRKWKYDVFVSFRGEDTRNNFTDHLFGALHKNRIVVFRDDINVRKGGNISSELLQAIKESHILIVIFSKNYASSTWCLQELANIADCIHVQGQTVLPIFYDVSPSEVRKQTGDYEKPFLEHGERFKGNLEAVQRWRGALTQVANLSGWDIKDKSQYAEIEKIIKKVRSLLGNKTETLPGDIVGMHSQVEELQNFLIDKSFITSEMGRICMHDLFKELGKSIVREKSMKEPRKWNWLWDYKDVHNVISENMVSGPETTVELNVTMHCEACAEQLKRKILQMRGVQKAVAEFSTRKVTVTGTMDANKLVDYVYKKTKKQAKIVPKPEPEREKKEEENKEGEKPADEEEAKPEENEGETAAAEEVKPEENESEKPADEEEAKPEENEAEKAAAEEEAKPEEKPTEEPKKEEEGENKEEMGGEESKEETKKEESGVVVNIDEGMMYYYQYPPLYVIERTPPPQLFSDENPNACSIS